MEENTKIWVNITWKKSDVIGYEKKMTSRAYATRAKNIFSSSDLTEPEHNSVFMSEDSCVTVSH